MLPNWLSYPLLLPPYRINVLSLGSSLAWFSTNGPLKRSLMAFFRLAWSSKLQLPILITVCFMAFDIRLQLEINIFWEANNRQNGRNGNAQVIVPVLELDANDGDDEEEGSVHDSEDEEDDDDDFDSDDLPSLKDLDLDSSDERPNSQQRNSSQNNSSFSRKSRRNSKDGDLPVALHRKKVSRREKESYRELLKEIGAFYTHICTNCNNVVVPGGNIQEILEMSQSTKGHAEIRQAAYKAFALPAIYLDADPECLYI